MLRLRDQLKGYGIRDGYPPAVEEDGRKSSRIFIPVAGAKSRIRACFRTKAETLSGIHPRAQARYIGVCGIDAGFSKHAFRSYVAAPQVPSITCGIEWFPASTSPPVWAHDPSQSSISPLCGPMTRHNPPYPPLCVPMTSHNPPYPPCVGP